MTLNIEFVEYVTKQLDEAGEIRFKKMFGEYGLYCDEKYFAVICNNQLFIKITEKGKAIIPNFPVESPYNGAKPMFLIEELENKNF